MITKNITYEVEGTNLTGYLADDASRGPGRPGVLVVHQGRGLADHTRDRARMLAGLTAALAFGALWTAEAVGRRHARRRAT